MAENSRPPVAIRIVRPYETEELLLENELETIGKTSVVLIGAHPRPTGVILRFEVTLSTGATVLRGEGRVLAHKDNAFRGQAGLTLRFTRLDPKSKAIVDRATAMREARAPSSPRMEPAAAAAVEPAERSRSRPAPRADSPIAEALSAATPAPGPTMSAADQEAAVASARAAAREKANATARANAKRTGRGPSLTPPPPPAPAAQEAAVHEELTYAAPPQDAPVPESPAHDTEEPPQSPDAEESDEAQAAPEPTPVTSIPGEVAEIVVAARGRDRAASTPPLAHDPPPRPAPRGAPSRALEAPPDRDDLLARLRDRAGKLPAERIDEILAARPAR